MHDIDDAPIHEDAVARRVARESYYVVFHAICALLSSQLVGKEPRELAPDGLWVRAYRTLDHLALRRACARLSGAADQPANIRSLCTAIVELQSNRILADYDPCRTFQASDAGQAVEAACLCLTLIEDDITPDQRRAFVAELLVRSKDRP
jgi:hypothetical protein